MLQRLRYIGIILLGAAVPAFAESGRGNPHDGKLTRMAQTSEQRPRGREFVGTPRYEPKAGWVPLGSKSITHGSGEGRFTVSLGRRPLRSLHLVADGNSVVIRTVRAAGRGGKRISTSEHNLYTGSSYDLELPGRRGPAAIEIQYTARADGSRAPATLTVYGEVAPGSR